MVILFVKMYEFKNKDLESKMNKTFENFQRELSSLRTGRANPAFLDDVRVDLYGSKMKIKEIATVNILDNFTLAVKPFDMSSIGQISRGILESGLGVNPIQEATIVRVPLPQMTEDRRKEMVKICEKYGEESKVSLRNLRRDENDKIKKAQKDKDISEDDARKFETEVQKILDIFSKKIDEAIKVKSVEILKV